MNYQKLLWIFLLYCILTCSITCVNKSSQPRKFTGMDAELYKDTPAWHLVQALDMGKWEVAKEEINRDSSLLNYAEPLYGNSLLIWTVLNNNEKAVELLLKSGAIVNKSNLYGDSPLEVAAFYNDCNSKVLSMLLKYQPDNDSSTIYLRNEALVKASNNCLGFVRLLVDYNANPTWISKKNNVFNTITPLETSIIHEKYDIVEYLLFELNVPSSGGNIIRTDGDTITITELLKKSYNAERTFDQEKTRQQIRQILDYLETKKE